MDSYAHIIGTSMGVMRCVEAQRTGCQASIWSTPRNPGNHAKQLLGAVRRCPHGKEPPEEA